MNSKMTTNSQLSTTEPKKQKQGKQTSRTGTITEMEITWRVFRAGVRGRQGEGQKSTGNKQQMEGRKQTWGG